MLYTNNGPAIALVDTQGRVTVKLVHITRDAGTVVNISGLDKADRVIDTPPDSIRTGDRVRIARPGEASPNAA